MNLSQKLLTYEWEITEQTSKKRKGESAKKSGRQWKVERFAFKKLKWFERKTKKNQENF